MPDRASTAGKHGHGGILVAALGDSIAAGSPLWDPSARVRASMGAAVNPESEFEYWASKADPRLRFRNCGVFGERTGEIARRLDDCARGASVLIVQGGINDIARAPSGGRRVLARAVGRAERNLLAMVRRGKRMGLRVLLANVLPWNNGYPLAVAPINTLNRGIDAIGRREHVPILDFYGTLEDPNQIGQMRPDWTIDGDHPSIAGYALLGEHAVAPALRRLFR